MVRLMLLLAAVWLALANPAAAQNATGLVVTTCGTLPTPFVAGRPGPFTVEAATGKMCGDASGGGGGDATAANQVLQIAQETAFNTALGLMADAACATDNGACSTIALIKRTNQRLTTINTTLGTPFQAGGSIGNTTFAATQSGTWTVQPGNTANTTPWLTTPTQGGNSAKVTANAANGISTTAFNGLNVLAASLCYNGSTLDLCTQIVTGTAAAPSTQVVTVQGSVASAATNSGNPNKIGGVFNTTQPTVTNTQIVDAQMTARGAQIVAPGAEGFAVQATPVASEIHVGEVGGNLIPISVGLTTSNNSVTTGKSIGGTITLANAVRVSGSLGASGTSGIIQNLSLFFKDAVTTPNSADIYFFNVTPASTCTDNTSFALSATDLTRVIGIAHVTDFTASNTGVIGQANNLAMGFGLSSATSLFACLVTRGTFAITTTTGAEIIVNVLRN